MFVRLPELVVESVETDSPSGSAKFGDTLTTTIYLKNNGDAPVSQGFKTALFVNDKQVGTFTTPNGLEQGAETSGTITWKADMLPTDPYYRLSVFADVTGAISVANRVYANFNTIYKVKGILETDAWSERETYTVAEKPVFNLQAWSTDEPWRLLSPANGVSAAVYAYVYGDIVDGVPQGTALWEENMDYDPVEGKFSKELNPAEAGGGLTPGSYYAYIFAARGEETVTALVPFKLVQDYSVTVDIAKETYNVDEPVE